MASLFRPEDEEHAAATCLLVYAVSTRNLSAVQRAIQEGALLYPCLRYGYQFPLSDALHAQWMEGFEYLLAQVPRFPHRANEILGKALAVAAGGGHTAAAQMLLEVGAPIAGGEEKEEMNHFPLALAYGSSTSAPCWEMVSLLKSCGALPQSNRPFKMALIHAVRQQNVAVVRELAPYALPLERGLGTSLYCPVLALSRGPLEQPNTPESEEICRLLLDAGAPLEGRDTLGDTALLRTVRCGSEPRVACALVERGADLSARDEEGCDVYQILNNLQHPKTDAFLAAIELGQLRRTVRPAPPAGKMRL